MSALMLICLFYLSPSLCSRPRSNICKQAGATLVELLVVFCIVSVLAGVSIPAIASLTAGIQLRAASNSLFYSLLLARSEAIKRNERVVLCKSRDGVICSISDGWQQGWIVFNDANNNLKVDPGEAVILHQPHYSGDLHIVGNASLANYVAYIGSGRTVQTNGGFQAGTITVCKTSKNQTEAHKIIISSVGKARQSHATVTAC